MILVSVIVPVFNIEAYLFQCIQSVLCQTYKQIELILVNDGSTDNSPAICDYFKKLDKRVRVLNKSNGGLVSARKAGLLLSTGSYIYNLDGDDWIDLDCIETMLGLIEDTGSDMVIAGHSRDFLGKSVKVVNKIDCGLYDREQLIYRVYDKAISFGKFFQHGINTYSWGKLIKRQLAVNAQIGIPDEIVMGEDAAFLYPLVYGVESMYVSDYCGYNYRQRPSSILKKRASDKDELENLGRLFNYLSLNIISKNCDNIKRQLSEYFFSLAIIRTGCFLKNFEIFTKFNLFKGISKGSDICLYSSGSFGQHIYRNIVESGVFNILGWFDEDYMESRIVGLDVCDPAEIMSRTFEYVLIATVDIEKALSISDYLVNMGVPKTSIKHIEIEEGRIQSLIEYLGYEIINFTKAGSVYE